MYLFPRKHLLKILAVGSAGVLGVGFCWNYFTSLPVGEGRCGPAISGAAFVSPWTDRHVLLLGIGDSVTAGFGLRSQDHSYFNRLARNPDDELVDMKGICLSRVIPNLEFENLAISGSTSDVHLAIINERLKRHDSSVFGLVVMTTGGNDLIHNYGRTPPSKYAMYGATLLQAAPWIEAFRVRLDEMLAKIEASFSGGCEIYLGDIYDPTDGVGDTSSVQLPRWPEGLDIQAKFNEVIERCAESRPNVHLVPLHQEFLGHGAHCRQFWRSNYVYKDPTCWFHRNFEDPNDRGYDAVRRLFLNSMLRNSILVSANPRP